MNESSIIPNIWRQIVNKSGTLCWWTDVWSVVPQFKGRNVLFIGIDVHHTKMEYDKNKKIQKSSLAGFVATFLDGEGRWKPYCDVHQMQARDEIIGRPSKIVQQQNKQDEPKGSGNSPVRATELKGTSINTQDILRRFVQKACHHYHILPDYVVVYRDGVAHSQLSDAKQYEVSQIKQALPKAHVLYAIVQKSTNSKFLVESGEGLANPAPGASFEDGRFVPDDKMRGDFKDFFLVSTYNSTSTAKPVHYCLIHGANVVDLAQFQQLTFFMCHMYPNWANAIKVPFVTQAAHKLAYLLGGESNVSVHEHLKSSFFYL